MLDSNAKTYFKCLIIKLIKPHKMKKGIFTLALVMFCLLAANAQADYKMYIQLSLEPNLDQITLFEKNLGRTQQEIPFRGLFEGRSMEGTQRYEFRTICPLDGPAYLL